MTRDELIGRMVQKISDLLEVEPSQVDLDREFALLGLNSVHAVSLTGELEDLLHISLDPSLVYEFPTVNSLVDYLVSQDES